ncbi:MAG: NAD(P)/FAD-dependent oxidoreductase, partial [Mycobacteriaceae bacterium]
MSTVDAVVIGAGHHGLVAAAALADAGWDTLVLEAADTVGGAVRSTELAPGFTTDRFSAFYPMALVSPAITAMGLSEHGLRWSHAPTVLAHPAGPHDTSGAVLHADPAATAAALTGRDQQAWLDLAAEYQAIREPLLRALFDPFPPVRGGLGLARVLGAAGALRFARFALLPARRMAEELFETQDARLLLLGNAMHGDAPSDAPVSGAMGYLLAMLAQDGGWPVPVGGSGMLTQAMASRVRAAGGVIRTGQEVTAVEVRGGRAVGVRTAGGDRIRVRRAVVSDTSAPTLYTRLLPVDAVPAAVHRDLARFEWDTPVVKIDYALDAPIPWTAANARGAGTVHLGADADGLVRWMADLQTRTVPRNPFLLFGQMTTTDSSRSPAGTESAWSYSHLPRGVTDDASADELAARMDDVLAAHAPGVMDHVLHRVVQRPSDLQGADANLGAGSLAGGTMQLHQQLVFRPVPGLGRTETAVQGLFLGSAAVHPGGGVHGAAGLSAARAA